jgi:hypothetical protein
VGVFPKIGTFPKLGKVLKIQTYESDMEARKVDMPLLLLHTVAHQLAAGA